MPPRRFASATPGAPGSSTARAAPPSARPKARSQPLGGGDTFTFSEKNDHVGWTLGGGLEYAWGNWLVGVEYNYYDLGDQKYGGDARPDGWLSYENELSFSSVLARVSYKFDPTPAPVIAKY